MDLIDLNAQLTTEVTGKPLAGVDQAPGKRQRGIPVFTGQRWVRLGQRDLNPPIDCHETLYICWWIRKHHGDVSPVWLVAHAEE